VDSSSSGRATGLVGRRLRHEDGDGDEDRCPGAFISAIADHRAAFAPSPRQVRAILTKADATIAVAARKSNHDAAFRSLARICARTATQLRSLSYPAADAADAKALEAILDKLSNDFSVLVVVGPTSPILTKLIWAGITSDTGILNADTDALHHGLGLPPQ
jgi:hypothetical protein